MSLSDRPGPPNPNDDCSDSEDKILDTRIEQTLDTWFSPPPVPADHLADLQKRFDEIHSANHGIRLGLPALHKSLFRRRALVIVANSLAATVLVAFAWSLSIQKRNDRLVFNRKPLVAIYDDLVARGFQPYYLCDDQKRFQETMQHRHGQPLALNAHGNRLMLGLSYPGGWTPETTAILFRVDGKPVVIFVDNQPFPDDESVTQGNVNVRQKQLAGSFMVEISPISESLLDTIFSPTADH